MGAPRAELQAIKLLARREHSARELTRKLAARGHDQEEIAQALESLRRQRLQSDERFAAEYVRSRRASGFGPVRIRLELQERGIDRAVLSAVLQEADWVQRCAEVRAKRFGVEPVQNATERARQQRYLAYRGFTAEQMAAALNQSRDE